MLNTLLNTVSAASEVSSDSLTTWAVGAVLTALVATLGFLLRNAFGKVETTLEVVSKKLDDVQATLAKTDGDRRVLEQRVVQLEKELAELKREIRELSEGIAR